MTKETTRAFKIFYCEYKKRRKSGMSKKQAICFDNSEIYQLHGLIKWDPSDVDCAVNELRAEGYVKTDILGGVTLQDNSIEFMENQSSKYFDDIKDLFGGLLNLIGILK